MPRSTQRNPRNLGRAHLVAQLRKRALSRRQAVRILNAIFKEMKRALSRGREVEFAGGKLKRVRKHFGDRWGSDDWPASRGDPIPIPQAGWAAASRPERPVSVQWEAESDETGKVPILPQVQNRL
jgi:hypothetical protein